MYRIIEEGSAKIRVPTEQKISKKLPVFFNPVMKFNRDISILLLNAIDKQNMQIALPLAGSGVRGIRFLKELTKDKIKNISFNDLNENAIKLVMSNLDLNQTPNEKIQLFIKDANHFLLDSLGFDYIDIDPFGSPNPYLNSAVQRLARDGILAVTATDTGCLCGTFPKACLRKYWATPSHDEQMHETGLRILIRKVQLIAAQFDKALTPIFSYSKDHYFRIFFRCEKGKHKVDAIIKKHGSYNNAGPLWLGSLYDSKLCSKMYKLNKNEEDNRFLDIIRQESKLNQVGFYDTHALVKRYKLKTTPRKEDLINKLKKRKYKVAQTHFSDTAIKSNIEEKKLIQLLS